MIADYFLDTNVLVYAATGRAADEPKRLRALAIMEPATFGTSGQVLQEFYVTVTNRAKTRLAARDAAEWIDRIAHCPVVPIDVPLVKSAIAIANRYRISQWDGAIVAAAERLEVPVLYSEDLNHEQLYGTVRVVNPFRQN